MKKLLTLLLISLFAFVLTACGNESEGETKQDNDQQGELSDSSGEGDLPTHSQLADSMAITMATLGQVQSETDTLIDAQLNDKQVVLTFQGDDVEAIKSTVDEVLMEIHKHTVDSNELPDGYATVYDFYNVHIKVTNASGDLVLEGKMFADKEQKISWS
jgi:hypothetical protein